MSIRSVRNSGGILLFCLVLFGIQQGKLQAANDDFWRDGCFFHWIWTWPPPNEFNGYCPDLLCDHAYEVCSDVCDDFKGGYVDFWQCDDYYSNPGTAEFLCYCYTEPDGH